MSYPVYDKEGNLLYLENGVELPKKLKTKGATRRKDTPKKVQIKSKKTTDYGALIAISVLVITAYFFYDNYSTYSSSYYDKLRWNYFVDDYKILFSLSIASIIYLTLRNKITK